METNKLVAGIVAAAIAVIVLAGVLMPALSNATATEDTLTNDGYFRMQKITSDDETEYVITWTRSEDVMRLNDEPVVMNDKSTYASLSGVSIVLSDVSVTRYIPSLRAQTFISGQSGSMGYSLSTLKITLSQGTETIVVDEGLTSEATRTATYDFAFILSNTGDYVMKKSNVPAYVKDDSELYAVGITSLNTSGENPILSVLKMEGATSGVEFTAIYGTQTQPVFSDVVINTTPSTGYLELYDLENVTATATYDSTETDITYSFFVVPYEVTAEKSQHLTDAMNMILNVIPLLIIVAVLLGVVAVFILRRE